MPLIKDGRLVADPWTLVADGEALPADGPVIVSLARFRAEREVLAARGKPLGVRLKSSELAKEIAADVGSLSLIALEFPSFRDGRAYSTARILRERLGFRGELRAVGDVLRDQFLFMLRCGFDAFEVADEKAVEGWRKAIAEFTVFYQPATDHRAPATTLRQLRSAAE
jgi:uncharacterized protein (DUF934 family)